MKRAKKTTVNSKGKFNKKKRFGKSIKNRCPSGFQTTIEKKFKVTGGAYIEVPNNYRASQYDHTQMTTLRKSCLIALQTSRRNIGTKRLVFIILIILLRLQN